MVERHKLLERRYETVNHYVNDDEFVIILIHRMITDESW